MKATIVHLESLFSDQVSFQIPQFQRPYAWDEGDQWMPLWEDVRGVAEQYLAKAGTDEKVRPHFMGAIVLQHRQSNTGEVIKRLVVDGQQRLTTLQLLIKAAQRVYRGLDDNDRVERLQILTENLDSKLGNDPSNKTKIRQSNQLDQSAFREAITTKHIVSRSRGIALLRAYRFFEGNIDSWLRDGEKDRTLKSDALEETMTKHLQLAVIDLDPEERPHIIFETLNARGEPLRQSDLIKNTVMYQADVVDEAEAADRLWGMFESEWWRQSTGEPRVDRLQLDRFLNHWMAMKTRKEVSHQRVAAEFRDYSVDSSVSDIEEITTEIRSAAGLYKDMLEAIDPDDEVRIILERMQIMDIAAAMPLFLWLQTSEASKEQVKTCFQIIESYLIRRMLCGLISHGLGGFFVGLMNKLHQTTPPNYVRAVVNHLGGATSSTTLWPNDRMLLENLTSKALPGTVPRKKMILEALEFHIRSNKAEEVVTRKLNIEHIMPRRWEVHWPLLSSMPSQDEIDRRNEAVTMLGNLTLTTPKLNPSLSNGPWKEKRQALEHHSTLFLNKEIVAHPKQWDETAIKNRSSQLAKRITEIWKSADSYIGF